MIARITSGSDVKGMVLYNASKITTPNKDKSKENTMEGSLLGLSNIFNSDTETIIKTIESYNSLNTRIKKPNFHVSLNFHASEILKDEKLIELATDYMNGMGYGNQPFAVFRHYDKQHPHIHITSTRVDANGKKISDSFEKYKSLALTENLEKKHGLVIAKQSSAYKTISNIKETIKNYQKDGVGDLTNIISNIVDNAMAEHPTSLKSFNYFINQHKIKRIETKEGNHSFLLESVDPDLNQSYRTVPGSSLYTSLPNKELTRLIDKNQKAKAEYHKQVMGKIYGVINVVKNRNQQILLADFIKVLVRKGVKVDIKRRETGNEIGKINGYLFTDIKSGAKYTATDFKLRLKDFESIIIDDKSDLINQDKTIPELSTTNQQTSILGGLLNSQFNSSDEHEEDLSRKKYKKRKKGTGEQEL